MVARREFSSAASWVGERDDSMVDWRVVLTDVLWDYAKACWWVAPMAFGKAGWKDVW